MAPVKRAALPAQRETRSTRSSAVVKKKAATATKKTVSPVSKKTATSIKEAGVVTRKSKNKIDEDKEDESLVGHEAAEDVQPTEIKTVREKTTRATAGKETINKPAVTARSLAAAPRRRIKITPLEHAAETTAKVDTRSTREDAKDAKSVKRGSKRSEGNAEKTENSADKSTQSMPETELLKTRQKRKASTKPKEDAQVKGDTATKARGRPKKAEAQKQPETETQEAETAPLKRTTRTRGAGSLATQQSESAETQTVPVPKSPVGLRKKVTFEGIMDVGDDKENRPLPKSKKSTTSKGKADAASTGLRAKPLRKPAAATTTRGRKAVSGTSNSSKTLDEDGRSDAKKMPHVLTPKKITQVAKSTTTVHDKDEDMSIEEDELNGSKTPVRDLSVSPRRPSNAALARAMSPAKQLDFHRALFTQAVPEHNQTEQQDHNRALASPARRLPASPVRDSQDLLKDSPRRFDGTKLLFPSHNHNQTDVHASLALNPSNISSASQNMSILLQSPKRTGVLDAGFFSQSAMKKSVIKSPFKASLLASPAKRLFSSTKKAATPARSKISEMTIETQADEEELVEADMLGEEPESDITVSSQFRASNSPMRIFRVEDERDDMDFDKSVLEVRSPLKVQNSPIKKIGQSPAHDVQASCEAFVEPTPVLSREPQETEEQQMDHEDQHIAPSQLEQTPEMEPDQLENGEDIHVVEHSSELDDTTVLSCEDGDLTEVPDAASVSASTHENPESVYSTRSLHLEQPQIQSITLRDDTETSEDELAADETPVRSLAKKNRNSLLNDRHSRMSSGFTQRDAGKDFGFTPLAAQLGGWQTTSPDGTQVSRPTPAQRQESVEFSPLASQHVEGEVMISRHSTPVQKLKLRKSMASNVSAKSAIKNRQSLGLGRSMAQRNPVDPNNEQICLEESPSRDTQFEEYMEMRAMEEETNAVHAEEDRQIAEHDFDPEELARSAVDDESAESGEGDATDTANDMNGEDISSLEEPGELTTDLVNFTNASETAMIDFNKLAQEAEELAPTSDEARDDVGQSSAIFATHDKDDSRIQNSADLAVDRVVQPSNETNSDHDENDNGSSISDSSNPDITFKELSSPILQATTSQLDSPSVLVIDQSHTETELPETNVKAIGHADNTAQLSVTPVRLAQDFSQARMINTIVSKVPLKPEGAASAIKIQKKRARSFGNSDAVPNKRISFGSLKEIVIPSNNNTTEKSPDRRVRTSVAPSPGGTSTPASKYGRSSFGGVSAVTTPGQMSFAIDDFGDSTLDGIELPDEYEQDTELQYDEEDDVPTMDEEVQDANSVPTTPRTVTAGTPSTSRRTQSATTPATVKKAPATATKNNSARKSNGTKTTRTPLKPVSTGVLNGAVVFVDVHTSEGADASGIFIELLTQMGARCVKEWRWNSRASLAAGPDTNDIEQRIGITHVVYKDGGRRTLEKVRDAKGEVLCVGVAWVLDCEREGKWLDESNYAIDLSILPRGGSKRRKSMEPRALLHNGDGSLSASRPRRSVSGELTELMKQELINTPARGQTPQSSNHTEEDQDDDVEIGQATPTGYISYDPRTAMTPGTPYLVSQGKQIVQMSAPPKQTGKRLFEDDEDDQDEEMIDGGNDVVKKDAKKFRMRNLDVKARRRTLGFKPVVGSPLAK